MMFRVHPSRLSAALLSGALLSAGCRSGEVEPIPAPPGVGAAPAPAALPAAGQPAAQARKQPLAPLAPEPWHVPVGISLPIEPGKGLGPIRFGAHLDTIERLMGEPCEQKRQDSPNVLVCRYSAQAVEFILKDGAVHIMHAHRLGRPFLEDPKPDFGIFRGRFEAGVSFNMLMGPVQEVLGKPKAVHQVTTPNKYGTVEVHDYPDFTLEYDRLDKDRVVLGGVILTEPASKRTVVSKPTSASKPQRSNAAAPQRAVTNPR
jgi:hypothetical protein